MRTLKSGKLFLTAMSVLMATFVLFFIRSNQPAFYVYGAVRHTASATIVKGRVTQGKRALKNVTVKVLEYQHGHWNVASTVATNNDGEYNMRAPASKRRAIRVEWLEPHTAMPILVHEFRMEEHEIPFGLRISPIFRFLATQAFSY